MKASTRAKLAAVLATLENSEDFKEANQLFNSANGDMQSRARRAFRVGDKVQFAARGGRVVLGTIQAINLKNIKVTEDDSYGGGWNVSPSLLAIRK